MIKNILLAEDDRGTALLVKTQLERKGFIVSIAVNGIEALKVLATKKIDLLITDVVMPEMDGVDLYEAVKKNPATADLPIIIVTDKAVFKESFTSLGVSNFVEKSSNINILINKIALIQHRADETKKFTKILIGSTYPILIDQMKMTLTGKQYLVISAQTSEEMIVKAMTMKPHVLCMDVLFQDSISSYELIRALRCFRILSNMKILTYTYLPENLGIDIEAIKSLEANVNQCKEAGADLYIGRYNQGFLLEKLAELGF